MSSRVHFARSLRVLVLVLTVCCSRGVARAQDAEYRSLIEQALSEFAHRNWPEARVLFRRAHELNPSARTQRGMGMVSYEMRDYVSAVVQLSAALADERSPLTDELRSECEQVLARSRSFVGSYELTLEPAQASLTLDRAAPVRDAEGRMLVPFGVHRLQASAPEYLDEDLELSVQGGEQSALRVVLRKPAPAAPIAAVLPPRSEPAPGRPSRAGRGLRYSWVALGATAAFGAAALGTWYAGEGKLSDLNERCERTAKSEPCIRGHVDTGSVKTLERSTNALLGLTGAALVATVVLASFEWPRERNTLALELGPQRASLRGSF